MFYLLALAIAAWLLLSKSFTMMSAWRAGALSAHRYVVLTLSTAFITSLASAPMLLAFYDADQEVNGHPISLNIGMRSMIWASLAGSLAGAVLFGGLLLKQRRQTSLTHTAVGVNTLGLLICGYLAFAAGDQLQFSANHDGTGVLNVEALKQQGSAKEVNCERGWVLVRDIEAEEVEYRCPTGILLGVFSDTPFAPWPSYTEGSSRTLGADIKALTRNTVKVKLK